MFMSAICLDGTMEKKMNLWTKKMHLSVDHTLFLQETIAIITGTSKWNANSYCCPTLFANQAQAGVAYRDRILNKQAHCTLGTIVGRLVTLAPSTVDDLFNTYLFSYCTLQLFVMKKTFMTIADAHILPSCILHHLFCVQCELFFRPNIMIHG